jgi:hypothetical protein
MLQVLRHLRGEALWRIHDWRIRLMAYSHDWRIHDCDR